MTSRANSLRSCSDCPARTDCMASVVARGPLLHGCDGMPYGWQEDWAGEMPPVFKARRRKKNGWQRSVIMDCVARNGRVMARQLCALGIDETSARKWLAKLASAGELLRHTESLPRPQGGGNRVVVYTLPTVVPDGPVSA